MLWPQGHSCCIAYCLSALRWMWSWFLKGCLWCWTPAIAFERELYSVLMTTEVPSVLFSNDYLISQNSCFSCPPNLAPPCQSIYADLCCTSSISSCRSTCCLPILVQRAKLSMNGRLPRRMLPCDEIATWPGCTLKIVQLRSNENMAGLLERHGSGQQREPLEAR